MEANGALHECEGAIYWRQFHHIVCFARSGQAWS
jgi:hypothetical protein